MITVNLSQSVYSALAQLNNIQKNAPRAINSALNRSVTYLRQAVVRQVTQEYSVKQPVVRKAIQLTKSTVSSLSAQAVVSGSPIPLVKFDITPRRPLKTSNKRQLMAKVTKNGAQKPIKKGFVQKTKAGYLGAFYRATDKRYPLKQFYGPSIPQMAQNSLVVDQVQQQTEKYYFQRLEHEVRRLNAGIGSKR
jgi:hypothetical protein